MVDSSRDYRIQSTSDLTASDEADVRALLAAVEAAGGLPALSEQQQSLLDHSGGPRRIALLCRCRDSGALSAYGQLCGVRGGWAFEMAVHPDCRSATGPASTLLEAAVEAVRREGGGLLRYWATNDDAIVDHTATAIGFAVERDLLQLRVPLPLPRSTVARATAIAPSGLRTFVGGRDEAAWLAVNNRAFADHPEQGAWDLSMLAAREKEPWFDPAGFFVLEIDGQLAGSCWTKVHRAATPPLGEIYVISVDPEFANRRLGQALLVAGLEHLGAAGLSTGMLYVDASNAPALALYSSLGFHVDHTDRAYLLEVPKEGSGP